MWQWTGSIRSCIFSVWTPIRLSPCRSKHTRCIRAVHPRIAKQASHGAGLCQSWSRMKVLHDGKERKVVHPKIDVNILVSLLESLSIHVFQSMFIMRSGLIYIYTFLHVYQIFSSFCGTPRLFVFRPRTSCPEWLRSSYLCSLSILPCLRKFRNLIMFVGNQLRTTSGTKSCATATGLDQKPLQGLTFWCTYLVACVAPFG